jgi:Rod binding domain-containing protein
MIRSDVLPLYTATAPSAFSAAVLTKEGAEDFEAAFIAEMLKRAGLDRTIASDSGFGGEAMASFLVDEISNQIRNKGGFGLADSIIEKLRHRE